MSAKLPDFGGGGHLLPQGYFPGPAPAFHSALVGSFQVLVLRSDRARGPLLFSQPFAKGLRLQPGDAHHRKIRLLVVAGLVPHIVLHKGSRPELLATFLRVGHLLDELLEVLHPRRPHAKKDVGRRVQDLQFILMTEIREQDHHENGERTHGRDEKVQRRHRENLNRARRAIHGVGAGWSLPAEGGLGARGTMR